MRWCAAGKTDIKENLIDGCKAIGRNYKQHLDSCPYWLIPKD